MAGPGDLGHIHDLVETADGELLVASRSGLYRITDTNTATLVGTEQHDLMSMAADNDTLYASGHPDLRLEQYRVEGHPQHLGLAESSDLGETWIVDPDNPSHLVATDEEARVWVSSDGARTWSLIGNARRRSRSSGSEPICSSPPPTTASCIRPVHSTAHGQTSPPLPARSRRSTSMAVAGG